MENYQANSNVAKKKAEEASKDPEKEKEKKKEIIKVVKGDIVQVPVPMGKKLKGIFFGADFKAVGSFVTAEVLLPALRRMIYDVGTAALGQSLFGETPAQQKYRPRNLEDYSSRTNYHRPVSRPVWQNEEQDRAIIRSKPRRLANYPIEDYAHETREDANTVLEMMLECIDTYDEVTVANYYSMLGLPHNHVDNKWGWTYLANTDVRQTRHGYVLELPKVEEL